MTATAIEELKKLKKSVMEAEEAYQLEIIYATGAIEDIQQNAAHVIFNHSTLDERYAMYASLFMEAEKALIKIKKENAEQLRAEVFNYSSARWQNDSNDATKAN